jgi:putative transposase
MKGGLFMHTMSQMPYHIGFKVKLYPSDYQKHLIAVNDGAKRAVYNHLVACGNERYRLAKAVDSILLSHPAAYVSMYLDRIDYLQSVSFDAKGIQNALPFLYGKEIDSLAVANAVKNYRFAWKNQKEQHRGVPTFKKKSYEQSYQTNAQYNTRKGITTCNVRFLDKDHVTLPKLGRIRIGASPKIIGSLLHRTADTRIGTITIQRDAVGEYWASFAIASDEPFHQKLEKTGSMQGIDLNLIDLIDDSDGGIRENKRFYASSQHKLAKAQRKLSRRAEHARAEGRKLQGSVNYQTQRKKVAYLHRKIERQRTDYLHVLSKREVENQDFIAAEDLKVSNMKKNHHLAKAVSDASWRTFLTMLQYKGAFYGKTVVLIPPQYTTQTCSHCGYIMKGEEHLTLSDREWDCPNCHTHHDRDRNAAQNILNKGLQKAKDTGLCL